jgi:uncharacterized membrane protein
VTTARSRLQFLWGAIVVQLLGRLLDLRWHLANEEFEGVSEQFEAHWLLWAGVLMTIVVVFVAARRPGPSPLERRGYLFTLVSGIAYAGVAIWHFVEHANGQDPELAHVFLALTQIAMILGAVLATVGGQAAKRELRSQA